MNPAFFVAELIILVLVCLGIALEPKLIRFERRAARWIRQKITNLRARKLEDVGLSVVPAPAMTAEEIVKVCNSL
jgi:hypothetical protein